MRKSFIFITLLGILFLSFILSCNKKSMDGNSNNYQVMSGGVDSYFVDITTATIIAEHMNKYAFENNDIDTNLQRSFSSYYTIPDVNEKAALYVFNYDDEEGGFLILSADRRYMPIVALAQDSLTTTSDIPSALGEWIGATVEKIEYVRKNETFVDDDVISGMKFWNRLIDDVGRLLPFLQVPNDPYQEGSGIPCTLPPFEKVKGPLMATSWGQECPYNDSLNYNNCDLTCNGKYPTGCVATAMAQVIRYWSQQSNSYPNYAFSTMPNWPSSNVHDTHLARLMRDCGKVVNMKYKCSGSSAYSNDAKSALVSYFDFSSGISSNSYETEDRWIVKSEIDANRPLLFGAFTNQKKFLFWTWPASSGHLWVCDGYKLIRDADCKNTFWFHMNWGWDGSWNGYFYESDWTVGTLNYNYFRDFIYNIHP